MSEYIQPGGSFHKDPDAKVFKVVDWSRWLDVAEIVASTWAISGPDDLLTYDNAGIVTGSQHTQVRLLGGTVGNVYTVTNHITTDESPAQEDERSFEVRVVQR